MTLTSIIQQITTLIGATIPIATGIALLFLFWGIFQGFGNTESVDKRADARKTVVWSLIALFVVVSLGGIISVFSSTFPDLRGGGGGTVTSGVQTPSAPAAVPGTSGQTNPITPSNAGSGPLNVQPATGRSTGPSDIAP